MNCYVCDLDNWHSMGDINPERELRVCKECGNVAYKVEAEEEKKMLDYYRFKYRPAPNIGNLVTTNHKLQYIRVFMKEWITENKGKKRLVGDVGCATGYIPAYFRGQGHRATGAEYTLNFRRFAENFYGIPVTEKLTKKEYDLIVFYHTLEHMIEPDKKLIDHAEMVKPGGYILVSCPEWFDTLEEASGTSVASFTHLFHKDHINVFSATSIKNLFLLAGLEVVKEDHIQYGQTYLLRKPPAGIPSPSIVKENWEGQVEKIRKSKEAIELFAKGEFQKAIDIYPKFPEAWMGLVFQTHMKDADRQQAIVSEGEKVLNENARWRLAVATWLYQTKNFEKALGNYQWFMDRRPNENTAMQIGQTLFEMGRYKDAFEAFATAQDLNPMMWQEAMNYMCQCAVRLPTWDERLMESIGQQAVDAAPKPLELKDPALEEASAEPLKP